MTRAEIFDELDRGGTLSAYAAAARKLAALASETRPLRVAILANHTFDIESVLGVELARRSIAAEFYQAGYDQYRQELLNRQSGLDGFRPDAVLLSLDLESAFPQLAFGARLPSAVDWLAGLDALLEAWRERSQAPVFVFDFLPPAFAMDGLVACSGGSSVFDWTMELNRGLRRAAAGKPNLYIIGAAALACASGLEGWRDLRMWYLARAGINPKKFPALARLAARTVAALFRPTAKCLVLDLDNTLWGGVLGDAGPEGIHCAGSDYPANAYADFQRSVLALRGRGILLAVASKNDSALAEEAFARRADMPLRREHFSDWEVHWGPKPDSIRRIASRLNIGLDSIVFLDDNPDEIALVSMALPDVRAYRMPERPEQFAAFLANLEDFDQLRLSEEDRRRPELYEMRKKQAEMVSAATDLESFYRSLGTVLTPEPASAANMDRIVQLIGKTNQFNLTARRHGKAELAARVEGGSELWAFRARDVHGDHGIVAAALLDFEAGRCTIDTFLMSCRVIGRTLETAILSFLEQRASARGATEIAGEYLPTARNEPCREFYPRHGFRDCSPSGGNPRWAKDICRDRTACPEWISIEGELTGCATT
jgi:FkbH-like protein